MNGTEFELFVIDTLSNRMKHAIEEANKVSKDDPMRAQKEYYWNGRMEEIEILASIFRKVDVR